MKRPLKYTLWILALLLLLAAAAPVLVVTLVDANRFKPLIVEAVAEHTGRRLELPGDLAWSLSPALRLRLELGALRLAQPAGFGTGPFLESRRAAVAVDLLPLLSRTLSGRLELDGLRLHLARDRGGRANWADLLPRTQATPPAAAPAPRTPVPAKETGWRLALSGLAVRDAAVSWTDAASGRRLEFSRVALETGAVVPGRPVPVKLAFTFSRKDPALEVRVQAGARLVPGPDSVEIAGLDARAEFSGNALPAARPVPVDLTLQRLALGGDGLRLEGLAATAAGVELAASARGDAGGQITGRLEVRPFDPRAVMDRLGLPAPATADPKALRRASLATGFAAGGGAWSLEDLDLALDDSRLRGRAWAGSKGPLHFQLTLDTLDLDRYLPPPAPEGPPGGGRGSGKPAAPVPALPTAEARGTLRAGRLEVAGLRLTKLEAGLRLAGRRLAVSPLNATLYGGRHRGRAALAADGHRLGMELNSALEGVDLGPLLTDLTGEQQPPLTGRGDVRLALAANARDRGALVQALNGTVSLALADGDLAMLDADAVARYVKAKLKGQPLPPKETLVRRSRYDRLTATAAIKNGVARNDDLLAVSPNARISGRGTVNLPAETLDYTLTITYGTAAHKELEGLPVPVRVHGPWGGPRVRVDLEAVVKAWTRREARRKLTPRVEKKKRELEEKLKRKLEDLLRKR